MGIFFSESDKSFTLHTDNSTYQMMVDSYGYLLHLYYGKRTEGLMDYLLIPADRGFSGNPYELGTDKTWSMDVLPQEFPCNGTGDYRSTSLSVMNADGSNAVCLKYKGYSIEKGKYDLRGLPAAFAGEAEAETLRVEMEDAVSHVEVTLLYAILPHLDIITRSAVVRNKGQQQIKVIQLDSGCLDFVTGDLDVMTFHGRHCMERIPQRKNVGYGSYVIGSRRGTSSHQMNPMMLLMDHDATEKYGDCYAMMLMYSGGFKGQVSKDQFGLIRAQMGLMDEGFSYPLNKDEELYAPELIMTFCDHGLTGLSHQLHDCFRHHICKWPGGKAEHPVLLNSWEASYFNFNGDSLYDLAVQAADLGMDMLVMDDGWFGKRDIDESGLGDWYVNEEKLGESLTSLVNRVHALGLKFGIWYEPESVNEDSDLFRNHPDWAFRIPGRNPVRARYQLVLDYSRAEVVDAIYDAVCKVLDECPIDYIKWDMNRSLSDVFSMTADDQGRVLYDYVRGLYRFLDQLRKRYPNILIEGCSGGGGRFDAGMLYYTPQIWCSDNTDAMDRILIQYGTSFGYPISSMGSHVSAVPNHQTGRRTSLAARTAVALAGTFGYELNPAKLSDEEKDQIRLDVKTYKKYAPLICDGDYYRLTDPTKDDLAAWAFVSADQSEVLMEAVVHMTHGNMPVDYVKLDGLKSDAFYLCEENGRRYPGQALMQMGFPLPMGFGDDRVFVYHFVRV